MISKYLRRAWYRFKHRRRKKRNLSGLPYILAGIAVALTGGYILFSAFFVKAEEAGMERESGQYDVHFVEDPLIEEEYIEPEEEPLSEEVSVTEDPARQRAASVILVRLFNTGFRATASDFETYVKNGKSTLSNPDFTLEGHEDPLVNEVGHNIVLAAAEISAEVTDITEKQTGKESWEEYANLKVNFRGGQRLEYFESLLGIQDIKLNKTYSVPVTVCISKNGSGLWSVDNIVFPSIEMAENESGGFHYER